MSEGERKRLPLCNGSERILVVFDFDHSVVDGNTDVAVRGEGWKGPSWMQTEEYRRGIPGAWTRHMDEVLAALAEEGVDPSTLRQRIVDIPACPDWESILRSLLAQPQRYHVIIASDSNTQFIEWWLESRKIPSPTVFTNPARWEGQRLRVAPHHSHACPVCPPNLCKGTLLDEMKLDWSSFAKRIYVGDGSNDLCPILRLGQGDVAAVRRGYRLQSVLEKLPANSVSADVVVWDHSDQIRPHLCLASP